MVFTVGGFLLSIFVSFYSYSAEDSTQGRRCVRQEPHHKDTPPAHFHFLHLQISCFPQSKHVIHSHGNRISGGRLATAVQGVPQAHSWEQQHWTTSGSGHSAWCFHFQRVSGSSFPPASKINNQSGNFSYSCRWNLALSIWSGLWWQACATHPTLYTGSERLLSCPQTSLARGWVSFLNPRAIIYFSLPLEQLHFSALKTSLSKEPGKSCDFLLVVSTS